MWAAVPAEGGMCPGYLTTLSMDVAGKRLFINAVTRPGGKIEVELLDEALKPIQGFRREDCRAFTGDEKEAPVSWGESAACPRDGVHVRFWITKSFLYGFEWR